MICKFERFVEFSVFRQETTVGWSIIGDRKELDILGVHEINITGPFMVRLKNPKGRATRKQLSKRSVLKYGNEGILRPK